jgi:Fic family protein
MQDEYSIDTRVLWEMLQTQRKTQMKGGIYHSNQIDFAYNSNRIEGSKLTHEQTRYLFETKTVDGMAPVNDVIEMVNSFRLFDHMLDNLDTPLTAEKMKEYHRILKTGTLDAHQDWFVVGDEKYYYYRGLQEYPTENGFLSDTCRSFQDKYCAAYKDMVA